MGVKPILIAKAGGGQNLHQLFVVYVTRDRQSLEAWKACVYGVEVEVRPLPPADTVERALLDHTYKSLAFRALEEMRNDKVIPIIAPGVLYRPLEVYPPEP